MRLSIFALILLLLAPLGCESKKPAPKKDDKPGVDVKVRAPGVNVDVDKKDGVDVKAGGVKVDTDKDGTDVKVGE